jgi:hypothetical protein
MEIDTIVPEACGPSRLIVPNPEDPYIADLLQVADSRIAELVSISIRCRLNGIVFFLPP